MAENTLRLGGLTLDGKRAGWRGLYPGRSKLGDVKKVLGEPASSELESDGLWRHVYPPDANLKFNSVYVDSSETVKKIGWAQYDESSRIPGADLFLALGEPKLLSPFSFSGQGEMYQWETAGVWGVVDRELRIVISLVFYDPADPPKIQIPSTPRH